MKLIIQKLLENKWKKRWTGIINNEQFWHANRLIEIIVIHNYQVDVHQF